MNPALRKAGVWILAALLYLLWPLDAVPDWMVLVGWADDLIVTGLAVYMAYLSFKRNLPPSSPPPSSSSDEEDPYKVLGVYENSSPEAIKEAYRARMAEYHPDKVAHLGPELRALADKKAKAIQRAYEKLGGR